MNEQQIKELRAHAGRLVAEGKPLSGAFEYRISGCQNWELFTLTNDLPAIANGWEWRIAKQKKQIIDWSHPYFKGCATNYGALVFASKTHLPYGAWCADNIGAAFQLNELRLVTPANEHANWQPFFSTPENDAKLRELAEMVKVEVRYFSRSMQIYTEQWLHKTIAPFADISNFRITGLQDGRTDNGEEAK